MFMGDGSFQTLLLHAPLQQQSDDSGSWFGPSCADLTSGTADFGQGGAPAQVAVLAAGNR